METRILCNILVKYVTQLSRFSNFFCLKKITKFLHKNSFYKTEAESYIALKKCNVLFSAFREKIIYQISRNTIEIFYVSR